MNPASLYGLRRSGVDLAEALAWAGGALEAATLIAYTPKLALLTRYADGAATDVDGRTLDLSEAFEARCFSPAAELRWLHERDGLGTAVVLSENETRIAGSAQTAGAVPLAAIEALTTLAQQYFLWGEASAVDGTPNWVKLKPDRAPTFYAPIQSGEPRDGRVQLLSREYIETDAHGNAYVAEERYLGLRGIAEVKKDQGEVDDE